MTLCAYCKQERSLTREHIIPKWYINATSRRDVFNLRAPIAQTRGELVIKDVCAECNNKYLGDLDGYGKELYEKYMKKAVNLNESVLFQYDKNKLVRWLLKLSYNSARANDSDTVILSQFGSQILGKEKISAHVRVFASLISPTSVENYPEIKDSGESKQAKSVYPDWFRLTQLRMSFDPSINAVQRQVIINSFSFTILAVAPDSYLPNTQLERLSQEFIQLLPNAKALDSKGSIALRAGRYDALQSIKNTFLNYPIRHKIFDNIHIKELHSGECSLIVVQITLELIEKQDVKPISDAFSAMVANKETATAFMQKVEIMVDGFDMDSRELWQISEVRRYFRKLLVDCPYMMFLSWPHGSLLKVFFSCWVFAEPDAKQVEKMVEFLDITFKGLNQIIHRLALSSELNTKISNDAVRAISNGKVDPAL